MEEATTYEEWLAAAMKLDELQGAETWKRDPSSSFYDSRLIQERLSEMLRLEAKADYSSIVFWLRSGLTRNLGGTGNEELYKQTHVGTKRLIERHNEELIRMMWGICECKEEELSMQEKLDFFTESRHALGKTALLLSGGASLGMYHFGVIRALFLQGLLPRVMSGSSAGAIVLAIIGVRTSEELAELFGEGMEMIRRDIRLDFFAGKGSMSERLRKMLSKGVLMDVENLQEVLRHDIGDLTFAEAFERTGRIINISVSPGNNFEHARLLNYLTAPHVLVWSAASASCALPGLFESVELVAKNARGEQVSYHISSVRWTDGSLQSDLPINRLKELFNVNYVIVSQTNPHAIPFVQHLQRNPSKIGNSAGRPGILGRVCSAAGYFVKSEVIHRCQQVVDVGLAPSFLSSLLNQTYVGDVTIVAPITLQGYLTMISNPTPEALEKFVLVAERRTWPSIDRIRLQSQLEIVLDQCVRLLALRAHERSMQTISRGLAEGSHEGRRASMPITTRQRHTHLDLNQLFGTSSIRNNSAGNLQALSIVSTSLAPPAHARPDGALPLLPSNSDEGSGKNPPNPPEPPCLPRSKSWGFGSRLPTCAARVHKHILSDNELKGLAHRTRKGDLLWSFQGERGRGKEAKR